jgi:hypothetical protein
MTSFLGLSVRKFRKLVPLIMAVKYVAAQKRYPPVAAFKSGESLDVG